MASPNRMNTLRRELKKVLDQIAKDPTYRQELLDNPREALRAIVKTDEWGDAPGLLEILPAKPKPPPCKGNRTCKVTCLWTCGPIVKTCAGSNRK